MNKSRMFVSKETPRAVARDFLPQEFYVWGHIEMQHGGRQPAF